MSDEYWSMGSERWLQPAGPPFSNGFYDVITDASSVSKVLNSRL